MEVALELGSEGYVGSGQEKESGEEHLQRGENIWCVGIPEKSN